MLVSSVQTDVTLRFIIFGARLFTMVHRHHSGLNDARVRKVCSVQSTGHNIGLYLPIHVVRTMKIPTPYTYIL